MGLDNGIIFFKKLQDKPVKELLKNKLDCIDGYLEQVDIACSVNFILDEDKPGVMLFYWRKCWNIRDIFLKVLDNIGNDDFSDFGYYILEKDDIPSIIKGLIQLCKKDNWDSGNSIWDYDEIIDSLIQDIANLYLLERYLSNNPDTIAVFYDSY